VLGPPKEEELLRKLGQITLDQRDGTRVHALRHRPGTYVIAVFGTLGQENVGQSMAAIYQHVDGGTLERVLFWALESGISYDRDLLKYYENNPYKSAPQPREVAVVTSNRMLRMVVAASAVGFRMFTGNRLRAYENLHQALTTETA
jgi:hypothetical protein